MKNNKIVLFNVFLNIFFFCIFLLLVRSNFYIGSLVMVNGIDLLNFIALEFFNKERFYVIARGMIGGWHFFNLLLYSFIATPIYSIFCYGIYSKFKGIKFFLIAIITFVIYLFIVCQIFSSYRLATLLYYFPIFLLTYIEVIILYRTKNKLLKQFRGRI